MPGPGVMARTNAAMMKGRNDMGLALHSKKRIEPGIAVSLEHLGDDDLVPREPVGLAGLCEEVCRMPHQIFQGLERLPVVDIRDQTRLGVLPGLLTQIARQRPCRRGNLTIQAMELVVELRLGKNE